MTWQYKFLVPVNKVYVNREKSEGKNSCCVAIYKCVTTSHTSHAVPVRAGTLAMRSGLEYDCLVQLFAPQ